MTTTDDLRQFDRVKLDRSWDGYASDPHGVILGFDPCRPHEALILVDGAQEIRYAPKRVLTVVARMCWIPVTLPEA